MKVIRKVVCNATSSAQNIMPWVVSLGDEVGNDTVTFIQRVRSDEGYIYIAVSGDNGIIVEIPIHQVAWMFYKDID